MNIWVVSICLIVLIFMISILIYTSFDMWTFALTSSGYFPRKEISGLYDNYKQLRDYQSALQSKCTH